jgi:hypothetical protein
MKLEMHRTGPIGASATSNMVIVSILGMLKQVTNRCRLLLLERISSTQSKIGITIMINLGHHNLETAGELLNNKMALSGQSEIPFIRTNRIEWQDQAHGTTQALSNLALQTFSPYLKNRLILPCGASPKHLLC